MLVNRVTISELDCDAAAELGLDVVFDGGRLKLDGPSGWVEKDWPAVDTLSLLTESSDVKVVEEVNSGLEGDVEFEIEADACVIPGVKPKGLLDSASLVEENLATGTELVALLAVPEVSAVDWTCDAPETLAVVLGSGFPERPPEGLPT